MVSPALSVPPTVADRRDADPAEIAAALRVLHEPGDVFEIRALRVRESRTYVIDTWSGYYDDIDVAAKDAAKLSGRAEGVYFTVNPCTPALLARRANRGVKVGKGEATADHDIARRRWLPVDLDFGRPKGISATDDEVKAALEMSEKVRAALAAEGWSAPVILHSGNGGHLLYPIALPRDDADLVGRVLDALAARFNDGIVKIDTTNRNAARIWKLPGTLAAKGDSTSDRPHRWARMVEAPERREIASKVLADFAPETPAAKRPTRTSSPPRGAVEFDLSEFMSEHFSDADSEPWSSQGGGGTRWILPVCPWNSDHCRGEAFVVQLAGGGISAGCQHESCRWDWSELRERYAPKPQRSQPTAAKLQGIEGGKSNTWPEPEPVEVQLLPVPEMNPALLPEALRGFVVDIAERMQCPLAFPAAAIMVAAGAAIGRRCAIRPKRQDNWEVIPNLWGAIVGGPGEMKSPPLDAVMKPLEALERLAVETHKDALKDHEFRVMVTAAERKELERKIATAVKNKSDTTALREALPDAEQLPTAPRLIVNDATVEKLGELLNENPNGLLVKRDELTGFLKTLDKEGRENDRAFYLEAWNGTGSFTYDRIKRGTVRIEAAAISLFGTIQPDPLRHYVTGALGDEGGADGLLQRFQLLVYPDPTRDWRNVDRWPNSTARQQADACFAMMTQLRLHRDENRVPFVRFDEKAQEIADEWRNELENRELRGSDEHPAFTAHMSKYRSLMPSLALICHIAGIPPTVTGVLPPVSADATRRAAAWCGFLAQHARRVYGMASDKDSAAAQLIAKRIRSGKLKDRFTAREIVRRGWSGLSNIESVKRALDLLEEAGWLRTEAVKPGAGGGRPTSVLRINPKLGAVR